MFCTEGKGCGVVVVGVESGDDGKLSGRLVSFGGGKDDKGEEIGLEM